MNQRTQASLHEPDTMITHMPNKIDKTMPICQPKTWPDLLRLNDIKANLSRESIHSINDFFLITNVDSTQQVLSEFDAKQGMGICLCEAQYQSYGQRHRAWCAPFGAGLWLSLAFACSDPSTIRHLTVKAISHLAACFTKHLHLPTLTLKWPNDLLIDGKKCAGMIIEPSPSHDATYILGLGINTAAIYQLNTSVPVGHIDLGGMSRSHFASYVVNTLIDCINHLNDTSWLKYWSRFDDFYHQSLLWSIQPNKLYLGMGIDKTGAYRIQNDAQSYLVNYGQLRRSMA